MPEGPLGFPRASNFGPLSRSTKEEIQLQWQSCPDDDTHKQICREIKVAALTILENQGLFAVCKDLVDINGGNCHNVARRVVNNVPQATYLQTIGGDHGWVEYQGRHYDAEVPSGVDNAFDLPFFMRIPPNQVLDFAQMHAEAEGEQEPKSIDELIIEVE